MRVRGMPLTAVLEFVEVAQGVAQAIGTGGAHFLVAPVDVECN